jgi:ATP-binding cassette subfamily C (CFTR/MRP) protein 1
MDAGQIKEFDSPLSLFDNPNSTFRSMCEAAKLSREAILRIRAGDYVHEVQEGVPANIETRVS